MTCIHRRNTHRIRTFQDSATARTLLTTAAMMAALPPLPAQAAPAGGVVTAGAGAISQQGATTTITQSATQPQQPARMVIDWHSFSSAAGESIVFKQPDAAAIALNRVTGANPSQLMGSLSANGQVFILNPNGVLFGPGSQVNVRGLLASTLDMDNAGFMSGRHVLQGSSNARVVNQGNLKAADGGYVALIGPAVVNDGVISAGKGDAVLAAGDKVTLRLEGGSLIGYSMDLGSLNALVDNTANGVIRANGGRVALQARAADALSKAVVNHAGLIEARTLDSSEGRIRLTGDRDVGQMLVSGTLDASAPNGGHGGSIETSAAQVKIADSARVSTMAASGAHGNWLIDPVDFEIASGSGAQTQSSIGAATLATALGSSNVTIGTSTSGAGNGQGDISVNADVAWDAATQLSLQAYRNIIFNASLKGRSVALHYGQASADGGAADYYFNNGAKIDLTGANGTFSTQKGSNTANLKDYIIVRSLGTENTSDPSTLQGMPVSPRDSAIFVLGADIDASATKGWNNGAGFLSLGSLYGTFDGLGHQISGLYINRPQESHRGLFNIIAPSGAVRNLALSDVNVTAGISAGGIAGQNQGGISRSSVSGTVTGDRNVGGMVGDNIGAVFASSSSASVFGKTTLGGLVGINSGSISNSFASGSVAAGFITGGLAGESSGAILESYSGAQVIAQAAGLNGGLIGRATVESVTNNTYATGKVVGGNSTDSGGLIASSAGAVINGYWNTDSDGGTGMSTSAAGIGKTGAQLRQADTFTGWDMATTGGTDRIWRIYEGNSMPLLRSFLSPLALGPSSTVEYSGTAQKNPDIPASGTRTATAASGRNAGTYLPYSNQQGYDLRNGELVIPPKPLAISATGVDKMYDGKPEASVTLLARPLDGDAASPAYSTATFDNKNVGSGKQVTVSGIRLLGADALNYSYQPQLTTTASITPRPLEISATGIDKVYDSNTDASATLQAKPLGPDVLSASYATAAFDDRKVGTDKTVTISGFTLSGADAANYTAPSQLRTKAAIVQRPLNPTITGVDKVYDGTTSARATLEATPLDGDILNATFSRAEFSDKNVGSGKRVTVVGITLAGADALNYSYLPLANTSASITPRPIEISATGIDKVYDGTTNAGAALAGKPLAGDVLGAAYSTAAFDDKHVGTAKHVTVSGFTLSGKDAANYAAPSQATASASISPRPLDITATAASKVYDGTTSAVPVLHDNRIAGDALVTNAVASFDDRNAATGKNVTVSGIAIAGADAGNYLYRPQVMTTTANITPRPLNISATAADKAYDGSTRTSATLSDDHVAGDAVTASYQRADFADKNGGRQKIVTVSGITLAGADAPNYLPPSSTAASASISPRSLTIIANPDFRLANGIPYRGGNGVTYDGFIPGETAAVLDGQLRYGGSAQGATKQGSYHITPGGLSSPNYAASFVDGVLTLQPMPPDAGLVAAFTEPAMLAPLTRADPALAIRADPGGNGTGALRIADCGVRMPENVLVGDCESATQPYRPNY